MMKFYYGAGLVCAADALTLLFVYDSVAGFYLGAFGATLCFVLAPLVGRAK